MTLPTNIGAAANRSASINNNISESASSTQFTTLQNQVQNDTLGNQTSSFSSFDTSFKTLIDETNLLQDNQDILKIRSFINGESLPSSKKLEIDLAFSIENNKNEKLTTGVLEDIKKYKEEIINNFYENVENKASMLLSLNNNSEKYFNSFFKNISDFDNVKNNINEAIFEKGQKIKNNNFENLLKKYISFPNNSNIFNLLTNNFIVMSKSNNKEKDLKVFSKVLSYDKVQKNLLTQIDVNSFVKKHCLFETSISSDSESKDIKSIINDVNVQNIVTMIRNLYFMSPNTLVGNYIEEKFNFINLEKDNLISITSEFDDIDYFKFINENGSVDIENFLDKSSFKRLDEHEITNSRSATLENSIDELNGKQHISSTLKTYINDIMISKLKNVSHIKNNLYTNFIVSDSILVSKELNKIFTGYFFNVDLLSLDVKFNSGIQDLLGFILFNNTTNNVDNSSNRTFKENYLNNINEKNEIIYRFNSSITTYKNNASSRDNKGTILASDRFNLDDASIYYLDDVYLKNKIDSFVKSQKLNYLKNKDVDLSFSKEIIDNIKNSKVNKKMLSYCRQDKEDLAVINSESKLFDLFFTGDVESENDFYSHIDIVSNHVIDDSNFKGLDEMKLLDIDPNDEYLNLGDNIKKIISLYYQENSFFSSSNFFKRILQSILNEIEVSEDENYEENNLTQVLYFNFFKKNFSKDIETKKIIAERFIKKAIQLDTVSSASFKKNNSIKSFEYDYENILEEDFDKESKESIKSYIDKVLNSSDKLKKIKSSIYSLNNIKNLNLISDYKRISNIGIFNEGYSNELGLNTFSITAVLNGNVLPNYCLLYNFKSKGNFKEDARISYKIENKNKVLENITFGEINQETGEREVEKVEYYVDRSISEFDVTKSSDISLKIYPTLCTSDTVKNEFDYPYIVIKDNFEKIFENNNYSNYAFGNIVDVIQDMLRMSVKDYLKLSVNSENDIDVIISDNQDLINNVIDLIEIYSEFYLIYSSRIQRLNSLKIYNWQKKNINFLGNSAFSYNGIISKHSNVYSRFKDVMQLNNSDNITIFNKEEILSCFEDFKTLLDEFSQSPQSFLENSLLEYSAENYKTHITYICKNIMHSLYLSDYAQAFNFDLINGFLNHQNEVLNKSREEVSSSELFNQINEVSSELVEDIELNFYNTFYLNKLSKAMSFILLKNNINYKYIESCYKRLGNDLHKNKNIFKELKNHKIDMLNKLGSRIKNVYNLQSNTFYENKEDYLNSNFKTFSLSDIGLKNRNSKSIIKIKVSIIDKFNLNHLYMPKIFLFSPMITSTKIFTNNMLAENNINIVSNSITFFDTKNDVLNRTKIQSVDDVLNGNILNLKNIIKNKFSSLTDEETNLLYRHLISCHVSSEEIGDILNYCYAVNVNKNIYKTRISEETYSLVANITEKQFFDVFNFSKQDALNKIVFDEENNNYILPIRSEIIKEKCLVYDTLLKLENMSSLKELETLNNNNYYDFYNISIKPDMFYYIDSNYDRVNNNETEVDSLKEIEKLFAKINKFSEINESFKKNTQTIDNFDIVFEIEVI